MAAQKPEDARHSAGTLSVHAGEPRPAKPAPITTPIAQTTVYSIPSVEELRKINRGGPDAFVYTRNGNPTVRAAEKKIAALEGAEDCVLTASGMAAGFCSFIALCGAGEEIVSMLDVYGGTLKLFARIFPRLGITVKTVPFKDLANIESYYSDRTRLLLLESPTNPTLRSVDIQALTAAAHKRGIRAVVDNTFATPILQKPLALGADISYISAGKFLGGHSDLISGAVCGSRELVAKAREVMVWTGGCSDPGNAYLLLRGLKTLEVRIERGCANARRLTEFLSGQKKIKRVLYPGLPGTEGHEAAKKQMKDFGCMFSVELQGSGPAAERFIDSLKLWQLAPSLGGVESTVSYPILTSHIGVAEDKLRDMDVNTGLVRFSVGIENIDDLIADLRQALEAVGD